MRRLLPKADGRVPTRAAGGSGGLLGGGRTPSSAEGRRPREGLRGPTPEPPWGKADRQCRGAGGAAALAAPSLSAVLETKRLPAPARQRGRPERNCRDRGAKHSGADQQRSPCSLTRPLQQHYSKPNISFPVSVFDKINIPVSTYMNI